MLVLYHIFYARTLYLKGLVVVKKLKLIYNPYSGDKGFKYEIDNCINIFQNNGFEVTCFRSTKIGDIEKYLEGLDIKDVDTFVVSGGDGTINIVVNAMMKYGFRDIPLGIIPSGTANDFARFMGFPRDIEKCCKIICKNKVRPVDLGKVGDMYFINVCAGGLFSNVSQNIDKNFKDMLGKLAYYIKGMEQLNGFKPIPMRITNSTEVIEDNINLFLVLNSSGTGGINGLSPEASIDDGVFDFVAFRNTLWVELPKLLVSFLKGEYLEDKNVIFFQDNYIKIENLDPKNRFSDTDCDGEQGPLMPVEIHNIHRCIKIYSK